MKRIVEIDGLLNIHNFRPTVIKVHRQPKMVATCRYNKRVKDRSATSESRNWDLLRL